ncbi:uncharacterized protein [Prorops nasuta]|uniref:uncharacterized protein n=1 Tax=Prorops nasuta TaxID=863751 RepID=UPI0034CE85E2
MAPQISFKTLSPEEYKINYNKYNILYGFHDSPFGMCLIGINEADNAVSHLSFVDGKKEDGLKALSTQWPNSNLTEDVTRLTADTVDKIFSRDKSYDISVLLKGTEFQIQVWKATTTIPEGESFVYEEVAKMIQNPKAVRAVGSALSKNNVGYLIPCHRVRGKMGDKFTWGIERKHQMLKFERSNGNLCDEE